MSQDTQAVDEPTLPILYIGITPGVVHGVLYYLPDSSDEQPVSGPIPSHVQRSVPHGMYRGGSRNFDRGVLF